MSGLRRNWDNERRFSTIDECCKTAVEAARITHQHKFGFLPAAIIAYVVYKLACNDCPKVSDLYDYVNEGFEILEEIYPEHLISICDLNDIVANALEYVSCDLPDHEAIRQIGKGWVAEETLAIALYCVASISMTSRKRLLHQLTIPEHGFYRSNNRKYSRRSYRVQGLAGVL